MGVSKATKEKRLSQGLCFRCGLRTFHAGRQTCEICVNKIKEYEIKFHQKRDEKSTCRRCLSKVVENHVYCEKHMLNNRKKSKKVTDTRIQQGLCTACGKERDQSLKRLCAECFSKQKEQQRQEYIERKTNGICVYCGKSQSLESVNSCRICFFKNLSANHFGSRNRHQELCDLFESQHGLCAVTNNPLILGDTASLDHIIPLSKGGTHDIVNLRFVHLWINVMKMDKLDEDFMSELKLWLKSVTFIKEIS